MHHLVKYELTTTYELKWFDAYNQEDGWWLKSKIDLNIYCHFRNDSLYSKWVLWLIKNNKVKYLHYDRKTQNMWVDDSSGL